MRSTLNQLSRQQPSLVECLGAWWNAVRDAKRKISLNDTVFLLELEERAKALLKEAESILRSTQREIEIHRRPLDRKAAQLEETIREIHQKAGEEPELRPTFPFWLAWLVAALAGIFELSITFPTIREMNLGPAGLALAFGVALTAIFVLLGHVVGLLRRVVHSRKTASLLAVCTAIGFAVPMAVVFAQLRLASMARFQDFQARLSQDPPPQASLAPTPHSQLTLLVLITLSMVCIVALFRFETEYGGSRYGLAALERKLSRVHNKLDQLNAELDALNGLYGTVAAAIQSRFDRLGLIYRKHYTRAWSRKNLQGEPAK